MSTTANRTTVVGVFEDRGMAQTAVSELRRAGFREDQIGVVARHGEIETAAEPPEDRATSAGEGAVAGMVAGAGIGGLWALGIAAGLLPGIGPVIAGGIFASILASAMACRPAWPIPSGMLWAAATPRLVVPIARKPAACRAAAEA